MDSVIAIWIGSMVGTFCLGFLAGMLFTWLVDSREETDYWSQHVKKQNARTAGDGVSRVVRIHGDERRSRQ